MYINIAKCRKLNYVQLLNLRKIVRMPRDYKKKFGFTSFLWRVLILMIMVLALSKDNGIQCAEVKEEKLQHYIENTTHLKTTADFSTSYKNTHTENPQSSAKLIYLHQKLFLEESVLNRDIHPRNYLHREKRNAELIRHKEIIQEEGLVVVGHEQSKPRREKQHHQLEVNSNPGNNSQISVSVTDRSNQNIPPDKDIPSSREAASIDRRGKQHQHLHRLQQLSSSNGVNIISGGNPNSVFATENNTVVMAQIGGTATLPCVVRKFNNGVVSWIQKQDYHLLTVGLTTYNADGRFLVEHIRHLQNWGLLIKHVQPSDEGLYECQVSTHPPTSIFVELKVTEASAFITGAPDLHLRSGSTLRLLCTLRQSTEPPAYVFWYHQHRMINYDIGVNVSRTRGGAGSVLVVHEADKSHNGNYTCSPSNAVPASINVHVLNATAEEQPAAMQHANTSVTSGVPSLLSAKFTTMGNLTLLLITFIIIIICNNYYMSEYDIIHAKNQSDSIIMVNGEVFRKKCVLKYKANVRRIQMCVTNENCNDTLISDNKSAAKCKNKYSEKVVFKT